MCRASRCSAAGASRACPALRPSRTWRPCRSTTAWDLVVRPPREGPRQLSRSPFCRCSLLMRPDSGIVDHLDVTAVYSAIASISRFQTPAFLPVHGAVVPGCSWPIALGRVAPWRPQTQHPEDAVQYTPVIDTSVGTPLGFFGSTNAITRHSKSVRSVRLMPQRWIRSAVI